MGRKRLPTTEKVRRLIAEGAKPAEIAEKLKLTKQYVYQVSSKLRMKENRMSELVYQAVKEHKPNWATVHISTSDTSLPITVEEPDMVNEPPHYKTGGIETIDFIEAKGLNYRLGNVVKYVTRADHKGDRVENLNKALWYLKREIDLSSRAS